MTSDCVFSALATIDPNLVEFTLMSSRFDDNDASLAIDSTRSTYAETGRQRGAWWLMKLRDPVDVDSITIDGQMSILQSKVYIRLKVFQNRNCTEIARNTKLLSCDNLKTNFM